MKAARLVAPRSVEIHDVEPASLVPGSVIVEISFAGIGGSDLAAYVAGPSSDENSWPPAWFGHEWSGRVVDVGDDVPHRFVGERVVGLAPPACGTCRPCGAGLTSHCDFVLEAIVGADPLADSHGAFASQIRVDTRRLLRIPEGVDDADAVLAEPASVAAHAVTRSGMALGDVIGVVGAGTIGLLVAELARLAGAGRVVAVDPEPMRRELACDLGADAAFAPADGAVDWLSRAGSGLGADVVFDCAGLGDSLASAVSMARRGGTVVAVGVADRRGGGSEPSVGRLDLVRREITLQASLGYVVSDSQRVLGLMAEDRLRVAPILDPDPIGLHELDATLRDLVETPRGRRKPLVAPNA